MEIAGKTGGQDTCCNQLKLKQKYSLLTIKGILQLPENQASVLIWMKARLIRRK